MAQIEEMTKVPSNAEIVKKLNEVIKATNGFSTVYQFKGSVQTYQDLLAVQNPEPGWVYNVVQEDLDLEIAAGSNFAWTGEEWDNLGGKLSGIVKTVNKVQPNGQGDITLDFVKNVEKSEKGLLITFEDDTQVEVEVEGGTVKTVNGIPPDDKGNIQLNIANLPVGYEFFTFNPTTQTGVLPLLGGTYSRTTYKDLWEWVQKQGNYLISESAWQQKSSANNGNVPFYSTGDGSTTFRVPSLKCWVKGANETTEVGQYKEAGSPNIIGKLGTVQSYRSYTPTQSGAFRFLGDGSSPIGDYADRERIEDLWDFDASRSSSVYGNADTVQPESIVGLWCVKAFGTVSNLGNQDVAELSAEVTRVGTKVNEVADKLNQISDMDDYVIERYNDGFNWYRIWKSGKIEQGGVNAKNNTTITFLKPFKGLNYHIFFKYDYGKGAVYANELNKGDSIDSTVSPNRSTTSIVCGTYISSWYAFEEV